MPRTNLRELFLARDFDVPLEREAGTLAPSTEAVLLEKDPHAVAYLIGAEGVTVEARLHGDNVLLPLAFYGGEADHLETAIQERLAALLDSCITLAGTEPTFSTVHINNVIAHLRERLAPRPLVALVANQSLATIIEAEAPEGVKVYGFNAFDETTLIGLVEPKYVGTVVTDTRPRASDPMCSKNEVDGVDQGWPDGTHCRAGLVILGGSAVAATVELRPIVVPSVWERIAALRGAP